MRDSCRAGKRKISAEEAEQSTKKKGSGPPVDDDENNVLRVRPMEALYTKHSAGGTESAELEAKVSKTAVASGKESSAKNQRTGKMKSKLQCTESASAKEGLHVGPSQTLCKANQSEGLRGTATMKTAREPSRKKKAARHERRTDRVKNPGVGESTERRTGKPKQKHACVRMSISQNDTFLNVTIQSPV